MRWKDLSYWLRGGIIGLIVGVILAYPIAMIFITLMMLISPDFLNFILSFTVKLIPLSEQSDGLSAVASANLGIMIIIVIISICLGIIISKIKSKKIK